MTDRSPPPSAPSSVRASARPPARPAAQRDLSLDTTEIDLREIIAILKRQRRLILLTLVVILGIAFVAILTTTPMYRATTLLLLDGRGTDLLETTGADTQQSAVLNARLDSEVEILRSEATALAVVAAAGLVRDPEFGPQLGWRDRLGIALGIDLSADALRGLVGMAPAAAPTEAGLVNGALSRLRAAMEIRRQGLTYLISVSASSVDPARAAEIANAYARTYIERQVATKTESTLVARDVLRRQIETAQADLAASDAELNGFIETNLARLEEESGDPAIAALRRQLETAQTDQGAIRARISVAEGARDLGAWEDVAASLGDAALRELAGQRAALERRLGSASAGSAEAIDLAGELARLDTTLETRTALALDAARGDATALDSREAEARDSLRGALLQSDLSAEMVTNLANLQQRASVAREQYQTLLAREQTLSTMANVQVADARIVSEALPPGGPYAPNRKLILALALVGGLGLGVLLAFLKEYYVGGVVSASQLQNILQARVPVTVPQVDQPEKGSPADAVIAAPLSSYAETFRKLRAAVDLGIDNAALAAGGPARPGGRVVLVCSALPAEGKTTTALSLARTYALAGVRTLLIDADLRKPAVAARLGIEPGIGLHDYLTSWGRKEGVTLQAVPDPQSPLIVLTAGERSAVPTDQLINSTAFKSLLDEATSSLDVVILDSPPLLPVVDTRYLARHADAVVQVVRYGVTTQGEVREAAGQLQEMLRPGTAFLGMLSHEEAGGRRYGYYSRYGSYYGRDH